jgi:hypothetical protein
MSRKINVTQSAPSNNNEGKISCVGDAYQPGNTREEDLSFDPTELKADNQTATSGRNSFDPTFLDPISLIDLKWVHPDRSETPGESGPAARHISELCPPSRTPHRRLGNGLS